MLVSRDDRKILSRRKTAESKGHRAVVLEHFDLFSGFRCSKNRGHLYEIILLEAAVVDNYRVPSEFLAQKAIERKR